MKIKMLIEGVENLEGFKAWQKIDVLRAILNTLSSKEFEMYKELIDEVCSRIEIEGLI